MRPVPLRRAPPTSLTHVTCFGWLRRWLWGAPFSQVTGLVYVAVGGDATLLAQLWPHCPKVTWVHSFFAGVDKLVPFVKSHLTEGRGASVPMTNGKGAFSDSLAEWAMTAILHFNKQMPRVLANRGAQTWDKFVMDTVAGKTLGVVGFGHIGQTTARMAKQGFNMKASCARESLPAAGLARFCPRAEPRALQA